jgi:UDP-MurNAc hydroxylase
MKFTFIANACGIFTFSKGSRLLMDPWLDDGVFEGSWCHYPPLKTTHRDLQDVDAIYLSHIHPDHYDERYFDYPKDIPIIILKSKYNFLAKNLAKQGYENLIEVESGIPYIFREATLTIFSPFASHVFHDTNIGNLIDSAIVIEDIDGTSAFNANDNTPDIDSCKMLRDKFGSFDLAMINYNAAGPYPSCFRNLSDEEKIDAHYSVLNRNIIHLIECCNILKPKAVLPFAGAYVIGGKEYKKNMFLGTTTWDHCAHEIRSHSSHNAVTLREGDTYDLLLGKSNQTYEPINTADQNRYISEILSKLKYPYELDEPVEESELCLKVEAAIVALRERMRKYNLKVKSRVNIFAGANCFAIHSGDPEFGVDLDFYLDERLLNRILDRNSHWNNAEIGCHIEIDRKPNVYEIDAHTMMQFFHH